METEHSTTFPQLAIAPFLVQSSHSRQSKETLLDMSAADQNSPQSVKIPTGPKADRAWSEVARRKPDLTKADWEKNYTTAEWKRLDQSKRRAIEDAREKADIDVDKDYPEEEWRALPQWEQRLIIQRRKRRNAKPASQGAAPSIEASKPEAPSFEGSNYLKDPDAHSEVLTADVETLERQSFQEAQGGRSETDPETDLSCALNELSMGGQSLPQRTQRSKDGDHPVRPQSEKGGSSAPEGNQPRRRGCRVITSFIEEGDMLGPEYSAKTVLGISIEGSVTASQVKGKADRSNIAEIEVSMVDSDGNKSVNTLRVDSSLPGLPGSGFSTFGSTE